MAKDKGVTFFRESCYWKTISFDVVTVTSSSELSKWLCLFKAKLTAIHLILFKGMSMLSIIEISLIELYSKQQFF